MRRWWSLRRAPTLDRERRGISSIGALRALVIAILGASMTAAMPVRGLAAQSLISVPDGVTCPHCAVELDTVLTIGGSDAIYDFSRYSSIAVDRMGRILVTRGFGATDFAVFLPDGSFLRRVGRQGQGPGEYRFIQSLVTSSRYVHAFDPANARRTVLDSAFEVVRTDPLRGQVHSGIALRGDAVLFAADLRAPSLVGKPLHVVDTLGALFSFGETGEVYGGQLVHQSVGGTADAVWTIDNDRYRLTRWDLATRRPTASFQKRSEWFDEGDSSVWPRSELRDLRPGAEGIWVVGQAPDPDWTERFTESRPIPKNPPHEVFDGVIDLVDAQSGRTIVHSRWDDVFLGFVPGSDLIARYREDELGVPHIDLLRLRLTRSPDP